MDEKRNCDNEKIWLVEYLKILWDDIHFNRDQNWRILAGPFISMLAVLMAVFLESSQKLNDQPSITFITVATFSLILNISGLLIALRHRKLFIFKMRAINCIETWLGLNQLITNFFDKTSSKISVSYIILNIYISFITIIIGLLFYFFMKNIKLFVLISFVTFILLSLSVFAIIKNWEKSGQYKCPNGPWRT